MSFEAIRGAFSDAASQFLGSDAPGQVGAWLGTYLVHGVCLFGAAAVTARLVRSARIREQLWRAALFGPLLTASVQIGAGLNPMGGLWDLGSMDGAEARSTATPGSAFSLADEAAVLARLDQSTEELMLALRWKEQAAGQGVAVAQALPTEPAPTAPGPPWAKLVPLLALAAGMGALMVRALLEARRIRALGRRSTLTDGAAVETVERIAKDVGLWRPVRVEVAEAACSPYATGVLLPRIVLPRRALVALDEPSMAAMLAHEVGHVARFDPLWTAAARSVSSLFFFQPLNGYIARRMDECAEFCCDEFAVDATGDEVALARCLTTVADWILGEDSGPRPACAMAHRDSPLAERVGRILETDGEPTRPLGALRLTGGAAILATALAAPGLATPEVLPRGPALIPPVEHPRAALAPRGPFADLVETVHELRADVASLLALAETRDVPPETFARLKRLNERAERVARIADRLGRSAR